ncbi:MAG TPA: hypothetical protein VI504_10270, partial [Candidatus Eisenbacteria bacterium]
MAPTTASLYRQPLLDPNDALFLRCLAVTSFAAIVLVLLVRLLPAPPPRPVTHVEELPQRFARLILEPRKVLPPPVLPAADKVRAAKNPGGGGGGGGGAVLVTVTLSNVAVVSVDVVW